MGAVTKLLAGRSAGPAPGADLAGIEKLDLIDITVLVESGSSLQEIGSLALRFDANGMALHRADGSTVAQIPWVSLRRLEAVACTPRGGSDRVELRVETDRKRHRFVVPHVSPEVLRGSLGAICARYARAGLVVDGRGRALRLR
jgi:hypothetical protein